MGKSVGSRYQALSQLRFRRAEELLYQLGALQDRANDWQGELTRALRGSVQPHVVTGLI